MSTTLVFAFSLGAHLLAIVSLAVLARGNERVRAYARFVAAVATWLLLVLLERIGIAPMLTSPLGGAVAHFLPVIFLLDGGLPLAPIGRRWVAALGLVSLALLPFTLHDSPWYERALEIVWYAGAWLIVAFRVRAALARGSDTDGELRRRLVAIALVATPVGIGLLVAVGGLAAIPLLSALVQGVVLYAIVHLSLYEMRATAGRTGALAAAAAEHDRRAVAGEIAAMVAHEVRNPLTGVRSLAQRLADDTVSEDRRRRYSSLIVREVDRVERMVSALLGASAGPGEDSGRVADTPLGALFDDVALLVSGRARRAGVEMFAEAGGLIVAAPPEPLAQVLLNLVLNAIAHAPAGSSVRLSARAADGHALIMVEDRGAGIRPEDRERIYEPFYSGSGGSGLGLAVVKRICDQQGWSIEARDTTGGGATFVVGVALAATTGPAAANGTERAARNGVELRAT